MSTPICPTTSKQQQRTMPTPGWWTTNSKWQKGAQETSMSTSLGPQVSFFHFFLFLILLTTILNRLHVLQVMNGGWRTASGKKGKRCRFWRLLVQVSFFSPPFHFFFTNSAIVLTKLQCTTASSPPAVHHYHLDTTTTSTYHHGQWMTNWGICWYFLFFFFFLSYFTNNYLLIGTTRGARKCNNCPG